MNEKEIAAALTGREYPAYIPKEIAQAAKANGLVIVYGQSDDLMEFEGAISDELGANDGTTAYVDAKGLLRDRDSIDNDDDLKDHFAREPHAKPIEALWCKEGDYSWTFKTAIPHETFEIVEDGGPYCRGIVFALADLAEKQAA
jgi:hypothetical protein